MASERLHIPIKEDVVKSDRKHIIYERTQLLDLKSKHNCQLMSEEESLIQFFPKKISIDNTKHQDNNHVYSRTQMLELKNLEKYKTDYYKNSTFLDHRYIPKFYKIEFEAVQNQTKDGNNSNIVLGPQKGSWNIGCHVSQPKRISNDTNKVVKNAKPKLFAKKFDQKTGGWKENRLTRNQLVKSSVPINSGKLKSDSNFATRDSTTTISRRNEPQWFSDGPTTINDTIELGGNIDEAFGVSKFPPQKQCVGGGTEKQSNEDKSVENTFSKCVNPSCDVSGFTVTNISPPKTQSSTVDSVELFTKPDIDVDLFAKPATDVCGSRFRHLFAKTHSTSLKGDSNSKLLKMLSSSQQSNTKASLSEHYSASDLEAALRSILLINKSETTEVGSKTATGRVLTLQEMETDNWRPPLIDGTVSINNRPGLVGPSLCLAPPTGFVPISPTNKMFTSMKAPAPVINRDTLLQSSLSDYSEGSQISAIVNSSKDPIGSRTQQNSVDSFFEKINRDRSTLSDICSASRCPDDLLYAGHGQETGIPSFRRPIVKSLQSTINVLTPPCSGGKSNFLDVRSNFAQPPPISVSQQNFRDLQSIIQWNRRFNQPQAVVSPGFPIVSSIPFNSGDRPSAFSFPQPLFRSGLSTNNVFPGDQCSDSLISKPMSAHVKNNATNFMSLQQLWHDH